MYKVSPSGIGSLLECPRCLWLYANESVARPRGIFPSLPGGMDELFKNYFDKYRQDGKLPPEIEGKIDAKLFGDLAKLKPWREIDFGRGGFGAEFPKLNIKLRGAIDELLVNKKGEFIAFDFKTRGYPTKEDTHKHYQHQLDLYALLFEENGHKAAEDGYLLFFWPTDYKNKIAKFKTELVKLSVSAKGGMKILEEVNAIVSGEIPKSHEKCEYCFYYSAYKDSFED